MGNQRPEVAYVNSIVSAGAIQPIRRLGIPVITLIHEFGHIYVRLMCSKTLIWSNHLVFSSKLTHDDIKGDVQKLIVSQYQYSPQGNAQDRLVQKIKRKTRRKA